MVLSFYDDLICVSVKCVVFGCATNQFYTPIHGEVHYLNGTIFGKPYKDNKLVRAKKAPHF